MMTITFPYGRSEMTYDFPEERLKGCLTSALEEYIPEVGEEELIARAMEHPLGSPRLSELAKGKRNVVIIASDHTRPVPSKLIIPAMLAEIRKGNPDAKITILIATGCHRNTTKDELEAKFGSEIVQNEEIIVHDCDAPDAVSLGVLPSGGELVINRIAVQADLLVSEGFIEPHFFAGFSGGRKSVLPGVASRSTVLYNHNADFILHPRARTGILEGNPIHEDMVFAARAAKLSFICNVVLNSHKKVVYAVAGDCERAHEAGADFLKRYCCAKAVVSDIVITTNGGYPLDQNIYQAVKGMTAAEMTVRKGGVIILLAKSDDGHGGEEFLRTFAEEPDNEKLLQTFRQTPRDKTRIDQWQSQIFARVLSHAKVVYVSDAPDDMVRTLHMTPAHSIGEALRIAEEYLNDPQATITAIPDGVGVIVRAAD